MVENSSRPRSPNGGIPLEAERGTRSLQLQLAQAQSATRGLQSEKEELRIELKAFKEKYTGTVLGFMDYAKSLKKKHRAEVKGIKSDVDTLAKVVRETRGVPSLDNTEGSDMAGMDNVQGTTNVIFTRSRKRARIQAPHAPSINISPPTASEHASSTGAAVAPTLLGRTASGTGSSIFIPGVPAMPQPGDFPPRAKRSLANMSFKDATSGHLHPARPHEAFPVCIFCYINHLRCDAGEPCVECAQRGRICKRAKCVNFEGGKCRNPKCLRAHERDSNQYVNLRATGHVRQKDKKGTKKGGNNGGNNGGGGRGRRVPAEKCLTADM